MQNQIQTEKIKLPSSYKLDYKLLQTTKTIYQKIILFKKQPIQNNSFMNNIIKSIVNIINITITTIKSVTNTSVINTSVINTRGFSLIEILIVLAIIGILLTIAIPNLFKAEEATRKRATELEMRGIIASTYNYRLATYSLPRDLKELVKEGYIKSSALQDEWNNPYKFEVKNNKITIISAGPDRKFGTKDDIIVEESF